MKRRVFLVGSCVGCISALTTSSIFSSCVPTQYISGKLGKDGLTISKDEFEIRQKGSTAYRSSIVIRNEVLKFPICLYRFNDSEYSALWMQCSHQGAELQASGDYLQCPAHGSEFNNKGEVTNGPADKSLRAFPVTVSNHELFIDLRKKT